MGTVADDQLAALHAANWRRFQQGKRHDARNRFLWRLSVLRPDFYRAIAGKDVAPLLRDKRGLPVFVPTKDGLIDLGGWTYPDYAPALAIDFVWTLRYPAHLYNRDTSPDEQDFGVFDPRAETIDEAVSRMLPELERRFRQTLEYMAGIDDEVEAAPEYDRVPADRHFDWLIRYQLIGESMSGIANADGLDRRYVSRSIHGIADLIGLKLRPRSPAGRPRKNKK